MIKKLVFYFFCICFVIPLNSQSPALDKFVENFNQMYTEKCGLNFTTSLELGDGKIEEISLYYSYKKNITIDDAKQLVKKTSVDFLEELNKNAFIKPDLKPYPFTLKQIDVSIFFRGRDGAYVKSPGLSLISLDKGSLKYYKYEKKHFVLFHEENVGF